MHYVLIVHYVVQLLNFETRFFSRGYAAVPCCSGKILSYFWFQLLVHTGCYVNSQFIQSQKMITVKACKQSRVSDTCPNDLMLTRTHIGIVQHHSKVVRASSGFSASPEIEGFLHKQDSNRNITEELNIRKLFPAKGTSIMLAS